MLNTDVYTFPKTKASKQSLSKRKPVCGVGINDSDYITQTVLNGRKITCPAYRAWDDMIKRCYSSKRQTKNSTYIGCTVSDSWLTFSVFREWWLKQPDSTGMQLDKDIRFKGNKTYSESSCQYVSQEINKLFGTCSAKRGLYPAGVHWAKDKHKFLAKISYNSVSKFLGYFTTQEEAHESYKLAKNSIIQEVASKQCNKLKTELLQHIHQPSTVLA